MKNRIFCLLIVVMLCFLMTACDNSSSFSVKKFNSEAQKSVESDSVIAENGKYRLEWIKQTCAVALFDKATGQRWGITPISDGEKTVDEFGMPIKKNPKLSSAVSIEYINESNSLETEISYLGAVTNGRVRTEKIKNGIKAEYYFDSVEIMIPVKYELREDSVAITVDPSEIEENENKVTAVSVAPYWCSTKNKSEDAYLFVPSGSGALVNTEERSQAGALYSSQVYGRDAVMTMEDDPVTEKEIRLPVYGAKQGDCATCAVIESAAESCKISVVAGSTTVGYSAVFATYQLRSCNEGADILYSAKQDVYSKTMATAPMTVGFYPLSGNNADYSGMAKIYRDYLKENGKLKQSEKEIPLGITFVGGVMVNRSFLGIPYKTLLPATTLNESKEIIEDIKKNTNAKICAKYIGFGKTGLDVSDYAGGCVIDKNFGSRKDLDALNEYAQKSNTDIYFDFDLMKLDHSSCGFSFFFDTARNTRFMVTDLYDYNVATRSRIEDTKYRLLGRKYLIKGADKFLGKIKDLKLYGISLETLSGMSYSDYSDSDSPKYTSKAGTAKDVTAILSKVKKEYKFASSDANVYAALMSDIIFEVPAQSARENIFSLDVPFYEMIFKGHIPMTSEPVNLSANPEALKLRCAESGCGLNYIVTSKYDNEFANSNTYYFFGSVYSDLSEDLVKTQKMFDGYLKAISGAEINQNGILNNGLHFTEFSNGITVYVNYSDKEADSPVGKVAANGFVWG